MTVNISTSAKTDERIWITPRRGETAFWIDVRVGESETNFHTEFTVFCQSAEHRDEVVRVIEDALVDARLAA